MRPRRTLVLLVLGLSACATARTDTPSGGSAAPDSVAQRRALAGMENGAWESTYAPLPSRPTLIRGATVMTAAGEELEGGDVLLENGAISAVGRGLEAPAGATIVDGSGKFVTPGLIDTHSHLGVYPSPGVSAHSEGNEATDPTTAEVWAVHSVWPQDPGFVRALAGGVTTLQILPGSANLIGGRGVTVRPIPARSAQEMMVPGAPMALKMACGENPKRVYQSRGPSTRMGNWAGYRDAFIAAQAYREKWDDWIAKGGDRPDRNLANEPGRHDGGLRRGVAAATGGSRGAAALRLRETLEDARFWATRRAAFDRGESRELAQSRLDLEALQPVLAGAIPLVVEAHRASDILSVLDIAEEFGLRPVILGGSEAWMVAGELADADVPVILKPRSSLPSGFERLGARFDNAALLAAAGVTIAFAPFENHRAAEITQEAGNAVRWGLPWDASLRAVTLSPAEIYGVADRYGSLEAGKVADVVVWSGDPFELSSRAETVVVRGRVMPDWSRQKALFERYRTIEDTARPAYDVPGSR